MFLSPYNTKYNISCISLQKAKYSTFLVKISIELYIYSKTYVLAPQQQGSKISIELYL